LVDVTDNKPLEIRDGSITGEKVGDINLRYEDTEYTVNHVLGAALQTRGVVKLGASQDIGNLVTQAEYDRLKCDVNSLKIKMNKLLEQ